MKYQVKVDAPDYLVGYGPDNEFVVVARMLSKGRAEQIARLLNKDETKKDQPLDSMEVWSKNA